MSNLKWLNLIELGQAYADSEAYVKKLDRKIDLAKQKISGQHERQKWIKHWYQKQGGHKLDKALAHIKELDDQLEFVRGTAKIAVANLNTARACIRRLEEVELLKPL